MKNPRLSLAPLALVALALDAGCLSNTKATADAGSVPLVDSGGVPLADAGDAGSVPVVDAGGPPWTVAPISAVFDQAVFGTHYASALTAPSVSALGSPVTFSWTIQLTLVDPAGAPNPTNPGSAAAVDPGCDNAGSGTSSPFVQSMAAATTLASTFTWFHPDAASSNPPGVYACDHTKEGPSGHQGLITVVASDGKWQCTADYKGTNSSDATSVTSGVASEPVCLKL
jgi:hypothetical protein